MADHPAFEHAARGDMADGAMQSDIVVVVDCAVEESALTDGKPDAAKMKPLCFDTCQHVYRLMGETGRQGILLREGPEKMRMPEDLCLAYFCLTRFWTSGASDCSCFASHSPQDCSDKADGHLDVEGELAKMLLGIRTMGKIFGHGCSLAELFLDARLDTVNDLPSF